MKILKIDLSNEKIKQEEDNTFGPISYSINHHLKNKTYEEEIYSPKNDLCIGTGPFMGENIAGTHRLIISARSPQITSFFISTLGGGAIELSKVGINNLVITGKAKQKTIIIIKNIKGKLEVKFETIKEIPMQVNEQQQYLIDNYSKEFKGTKYRSLVVGKASEKTNMGAINSIEIKENKINYGSEGWAGRGGMGSLLLQAHNVAGIMFGGDYVFEKKLDSNKMFIDEFKTPMVKKIYDATEKYRYVDKLKTGGTFGVNFLNEKENTLWFNWQSIKLPEKIRMELYDKNIKNHYLKQFNKEVIEPKSFKTCGEACPAVCKKVIGKSKRDYEPTSACGPQCGVFDLHHVEIIAGAADELGFDAIEAGNLTSYVFEGLSKGIFKKEDFLLDNVPIMNEKVTLADSKKNAELGRELLTNIALGKLPKLSNGIRQASKELKQPSFANYMSYGKKGFISPNMYFVPGFLIPLPIQGKFHTYYGKDYFNPKELAEKSTIRAIKELYSEEGGVCRFHRGWSEVLVPKFAKEYGITQDFYEYSKDLFKKIMKYNKLAKTEPIFYETKLTKEFIYEFIKSKAKESDEASKWMKKFDNDFEKTIKEYYEELKKGINEVI